jgi:hypothetical protein
MEDANFDIGIGNVNPFLSSSPDGEQQELMPPVASQGRESVGEAASTAGAGGSGQGTGSTPGHSVPGASGQGTGSDLKKSKKRSWVWKHFTDFKDYIDEQGNKLGPKAVCNYCGVAYAGNSTYGVGSHGRHLKKQHLDKLTPAESGSTVDGKNVLANFDYSKEKMRLGLALYVASAEQPFTFGDDIRLENWIQTCLNPCFTKVSRNTIRSDLILAHVDLKNTLINEFSNLGTIAFTSDMWSGCNNCGYASVTAHYIDSSWTVQSKIIAFRLVEFPHDADQIFETIMGVFTEYGVSEKVLSITFDNHSANTGTIPMFESSLPPTRAGILLHVRCACHILNLVVQDGLKHIEPQLQKIRAAVLYISTSGARQQDFNKVCASRHQLKPKMIKADVPHRWNSTYLMLKSCTKHCDAITGFIHSRHSNLALTSFDWKIAFEFMDFLKVFYSATLAFSGSHYPTTCLVLRHLYNISVTFRNYREKPNFIDACIVMEKKFRKYFENMPVIFIFGAVMDPRFKLAGADLLLRGISDNLMITGLPSVDNVSDKLNTMYDSYDSRFSTRVSSTSIVSSSLPSSICHDASLSLLTSSFGPGGTSVPSHCELRKYLDLETVEADELANFDILTWWKSKELVYPVLSIMARDLLTPPVSSVASESCFSAAKRVLDDKRSRLAPDILDCLISLKDWEDTRLGIKKACPKDEFRGYFADSDVDNDE